MQDVDKAGCETLTKKYTYLTSTLQANICDLLPHFFEKKLISPRQKQKIECVTKEDGQISGCEKLLDALLGNGSEGAFQKFLEILTTQPHLDYLVPELQREWSFNSVGNCTL